MSKYIILSLSVFLTITFFSCKEEDILSPKITLTHPNDTVRNVLNIAFVEPGYKALDNVDGDIKDRVFIDNDVDVNLVGLYEIKYSVVDEAGNESQTKKRMVEVYNQERAIQGNYYANNIIMYPVQETIDYQTSIYADTTINNRLYFSLFADTLEVPVYVMKSNDSIFELPLQSHIINNITYTFSGIGMVLGNHIEIDYIKQFENTSYLSKIICDKI